MKLKIEIEMNNAAFEPRHGAEAARVMREVAEILDADSELSEVGDSFTLRDFNGNRVGTAKVTR